MANQSVLELAVGTGKWDAGLKKAKSALDNFTQANGGLQQALDKESQKMGQFVRMMGGMESTAKTAKGQMNDYKSTIEQLTMQYNRMTEAQKKVIGQDYLQAIDQMKSKYQAVGKEIQEMNRSLNNVHLPDMKAGGGGLFAGLGDKMSGALQVFGGNMLTKAAGAVANLGSEIFSSVQQGVELARQGEGIRIAFERLGRGDILDGLREATHGTVTDLELMKAAVKFNDFKLPVEELGTMLAFAQQKAKDTGQSVDYMVDSIVTGLGRKSLMILDNLGLSANEIKEKMAETGDMTKAVGAIIREQMSKAGDYVETAADRAAQADVELKNAMEELGRTFQPLTDASDSLWNSIKVGALNALNTAVKPLIQALAEAGTLGQGARSSAGFNNLGGNSKVDRMIGRLGNGKSAGAYSIYKQQLAEFDKYINNKQFQIAAYGGDNSSVAQSAKAKLQTELDGALKMREEYVKRAQELSKPVDVKIDTKGAEQNVESLKVKLIELQAQRKKAIAAGDTDLSKNLAKQISQVKSDIKGLGGTTTTSTTHKATPQETASNKVKDAERTYAETLMKSSIRMEAGLDSTLEYKKRELSAQERLFDAYNDAYATYQDPAYKKASMEAADKIRALAGEVKAETDAQEAAKKSARELEAAQKKLADAHQKLADAQATGSATAVFQAQKAVSTQHGIVSRLQNPSTSAPQQPTGFEALKQTVQAEIKFDQMKVDETTLHTLLQTALQNGLDYLTPDYAGLQERIAKGIDIPDSTWIELQNEINEKLKELGIDPIKINLETGGVEKVSDSVKALQATTKTTAQVVGTIGQAFNAIEDPAAKVAAVVAQAIANIALAYSDSLAKDQPTKSNIFAFIAAAAAATVSMVSTIASIHQATGYARGGVIKAANGAAIPGTFTVPGTTYSNDQIPAMLNAGETVLTRAQAGNIASQLQGAGGSINLNGVLTGENIFLSADRYARRSGRGELVTFHR